MTDFIERSVFGIHVPAEKFQAHYAGEPTDISAESGWVDHVARIHGDIDNSIIRAYVADDCGETNLFLIATEPGEFTKMSEVTYSLTDMADRADQLKELARWCGYKDLPEPRWLIITETKG